MLRTLTLAASLLATSGAALAYDDYAYRHGRVVSVQPNVIISFGTRHHDGFRILYESGGHRYWTHSYHRPGPVIVLPPRHITHIHHSRHHGWDDRRDWRDDRRDWRHDRQHDWRDHHRHGRHD
ncbi:MAG: hypothetical protein LDL16_08935 [Thiobacillus sp.]|nr:hypothetical protein [Thiobacillus sp.]